ncbi:MAG: hypothetical protein BWX55_01037 [Deltaproteobacteria bacterium ADurb.Bin022]|nr:MAG: hypothetical protein BWX55_01037 [Deltaproteobacteria bacterium ADurb.Bin022]
MFALLNAFVDVETGNAAPRTLTHAVDDTDDKSRAIKKFNQTRRHDSNHPRMPFIGGENEGIHFFQGTVFADHFQNVAQYFFLHQLAMAIVGIKLFGQRPRFRQIVGQKQFNGVGGGGDASGGVDPGNQGKGSLERIDDLIIHPADFLERLDARAAALGDQLQADFGEDSVFVRQWSDVANRSQRNDIQIFSEIRIMVVFPEAFLVQSAAQSDEKVKRDAHAGKTFERVRAIVAIGVDGRCCGRQSARYFMMVQNNRINAQGPGIGNLFHIGDSAIDRNNQADAVFFELVDCRFF